MPGDLASTMVQVKAEGRVVRTGGGLDGVICSNWQPVACGCTTMRCRDVSACSVYSLGCPCHTPSGCDY